VIEDMLASFCGRRSCSSSPISASKSGKISGSGYAVGAMRDNVYDAKKRIDG
jgi:hypothetical protein